MQQVGEKRAYTIFLLSNRILKFVTDIRTFEQVTRYSLPSLVFMCVQHKSIENTIGKGEIARNEQFLLFQ